MKRSIFILLAFICVLFGVACANGQIGRRDDRSRTINERKRHQQHRIANGIKHGTLTAGETSRLEKREARTNRMERKFRHSGNGISNSERKKLVRRLNNNGKAINAKTHNNKGKHSSTGVQKKTMHDVWKQ